MKLLRSIWLGLVNFTLIFLPLIVLIVLVVEFGQPIVELYREYFLGNPAQELVRTTRTLEANSGSRVPFDRLKRQFNGVQTMENTSDTELSGIQRSVVRIHGAVVNRLGSGDLLAVVDSYSDSYSRLLNHGMIDRVFERPDLVRQNLNRDLARIRKLPKLPSHPVKGLDTFWTNSDTVARIVERYGSIYANQVSCEQVFKVNCGDVYDESVELSTEYMTQYLNNWPDFSTNLPDRVEAFDNRARSLVEQFFGFTNEIEGYLQADPWQRYKSFLEAYEEYKTNYRTNIAEWYTTVMENFSLTARDFSERKWSKDFSVLESLRGIERSLRSNSRLREIVLTKENRNIRKNVLERLKNLYVEVNALDQFESGFDLSSEGLRSLRLTIKTLPNGETELTGLDEQLDQARKLFEQMQTAIERKQYGDLLASLQRVSRELENSGNAPLWNIMGTKFLLASRDRVTTPSWQPTTGQEHSTYRSIVKLYGDLGSTLGLSSLSNDWVQQTLIALRSRRFNQLKHNLLKEVENFESGDVPDVVNLLEEIQGISDLPPELSTRSREILFEVAVIERIQVGSSKVFETFSEQFDSQQARSAWTEVDQLVASLEIENPSEFLGNNSLKDYVSRWGDWLETNTDGSMFDELIVKQARGSIVSFTERLTEYFKTAVRNPSEQQPTITMLLRDYRNLSEGLKLVNELPGLDREYTLEPWRNTLLVRQNFNDMLSTINNLKKGSLLSDNSTFNEYKNSLEEFEWRPLPLEYNADREVELLHGINRSLERKAIELKEASQDDWLPGWGGRVQSGDVLKPWISFLERLDDETRHPAIASAATTVKQRSEATMEELN